MNALVSLLLLAAAPKPATPPPPDSLSFVREGTAWLQPAMLCTDHADHSAHGLSYLVSFDADQRAELRFQDAQDGAVSRTVKLGPVTVQTYANAPGSESVGIHLERPIAGTKQVLAFNSSRPRKTPPWLFSANVLTVTAAAAHGPPATDPNLGHALECPGGPLLFRCAAPGWDIRVQQTQGTAGPRLSYAAWHGALSPSLVIDVPWRRASKAVSRKGTRDRLTFKNKDARYVITASEDPKAPSARIEVKQAGKAALEIACTGYTVSPAWIQAAKHAKR